MQAKSITGKTADAIGTAIRDARADGFDPTLAIIFISVRQDRKAVSEILRNEKIDFIGATSSGEFINGHQSEGEITMMLFDIRKDYYSILIRDTHDKSLADSSREIAQTIFNQFRKPGMILCSTCFSTQSRIFDGNELMDSLQVAMGRDTKIFGGMAGDDAAFTGTWIFSNEGETDEGFTVLVFDSEKIALHGMAVSGWKPLGKVRTVTKSENGWLYSLDDQPALDMYLRYLGQSLEQKQGIQRDFIEGIGLYHPFLSIDAGDPVLRTPLEIDQEKNAIRLDFPIPEGKQLQFTLPPDFDIVETVLEHANQVQQEQQATADALLVFSCLGRLSALGPMAQEENEGLHKIWKAPMAGFYTYGEYGKDASGEHGFHSTTCSWVALKEK